MQAIPIRVNASKYDLFIILEQTDIERIQKYDPAKLALRKLSRPWRDLQPREVVITYMTKEDQLFIAEMSRLGDIRRLTQYLTRGFEFRPDLGDKDEDQYEVLSEGPKPSPDP